MNKGLRKAGIVALAIWITGSTLSLNGQERVTVVPYPQELRSTDGDYVPAGKNLT